MFLKYCEKMLTKKRISEISKLHLKKYREELRQSIVEGTKSVLDLLNSDFLVHEVLGTEKWYSSHAIHQLDKSKFTIVTSKEMERISCLHTPQEVMAIVSFPIYTLTDIPDQSPLLVLDDIRDPGNLGTIIRTAEWFGFKYIICSANCVELTNPKTLQATMGSFCRVKLIYTDLVKFFQNTQRPRRVIGTFLEGKSISEIDFHTDDILVIGNESMGISESISSFINLKVHIPAVSDSRAESLNASVATAILLYNFRDRFAK